MICYLLPSNQAMGVREVAGLRRGPIHINKSTSDARCYRFLKYCLFKELIELNESKNLDFNQTFTPRTVQFRTRWGTLESCTLIWSADLQICRFRTASWVIFSHRKESMLFFYFPRDGLLQSVPINSFTQTCQHKRLHTATLICEPKPKKGMN